MSDMEPGADTVVLATVDGTYFEIPAEVLRQYRVEKPAGSDDLKPTGIIFEVLQAGDDDVVGHELPVELPTCPVGYRLVVRQAGYYGTKFYCIPSQSVGGLLDAILGGH